MRVPVHVVRARDTSSTSTRFVHEREREYVYENVLIVDDHEEAHEGRSFRRSCAESAQPGRSRTVQTGHMVDTLNRDIPA